MYLNSFFRTIATYLSMWIYLSPSSAFGLALDFFAHSPNALSSGGGGSSLSLDEDGIIINPASVAVEKKYSLAAGYLWGEQGQQDRYSLSVIDSKTAGLSAGLIMTKIIDDTDTSVHVRPISKRYDLALAKRVGSLVMGVSGHYVELTKQISANNNEAIKQKFVTSVGVIVARPSGWRFAASRNYFGNDGFRAYLPSSTNAGLGWFERHGNFFATVDYILRDLTEVQVNSQNDAVISSTSEMSDNASKIMVSGGIRVYRMMMLELNYGRSEKGGLPTLGAAIKINNRPISISYHSLKGLGEGGGSSQAIQAQMALML
jgi:hypothetical protein